MCGNAVGNAPMNLSHRTPSDWVLSTALIVATGRTELHVEQEEKEEYNLCTFEQTVELGCNTSGSKSTASFEMFAL